MPISTIPLSRGITLASAFTRYAPLTMSSNDPALSNADWVRQFLLSAPFGWRWNRVTTGFTCTVGQTDYQESVPDFGWIEKAYITDPSDGARTTELEVSMNLAVESTPNLPARISPVFEDGSGDVTFRVFPAPAQEYIVTVTYQKAAPIFQSTSETWAPIPDYMSYLYNLGFLAKTYEYINDPRYLPTMQLFLQSTVSANQGLTETQKSIFLLDRMDLLRQQVGVQSGRG
jgi:hypothetical protein